MKKCFFCAEMIQDEAIKCRYCLSDLKKVRTETNEEKKKKETESKLENQNDNNEMVGRTNSLGRKIFYFVIIVVCLSLTFFILNTQEYFNSTFSKEGLSSLIYKTDALDKPKEAKTIYIVRIGGRGGSVISDPANEKIYYGYMEKTSKEIKLENAYEQIVINSEIKLKKVPGGSISFDSFRTSAYAPLDQNSNIVKAIRSSNGSIINLSDKNIHNPDGEKLFFAKKIDNLGYSFYLAQIDHPGAQSISDKTKNDITKVIQQANFPKQHSSKIVFVIINTLALEAGKTYLMAQNEKIPVRDLSPDFLQEGGGGMYYDSSENDLVVIYIRKEVLEKNILSYILTHELGHFIGSQMTDAEWAQFYELRNIPKNTPRKGDDWKSSPGEDFAEVYMNIFTGGEIRTIYGYFAPGHFGLEAEECLDIKFGLVKDQPLDYFFIFNDEFEKKYGMNKELQNCRKDVFINSLEKPKEFDFSQSSYKNIVTEETKKFVNTLLGRLNKAM